jgi:hypothetical protein
VWAWSRELRNAPQQPAGFDRAAFHQEFNASMARFFREHLVVDGSAR